ncbi:lysozyme c-1 [Cimex lectularius]|uniref:lysozyme n=1 Tax=Cimex lectularius TaxID=79782 RepID=A0A8I6RHG6_CIMLE|nr:lysozyme c-1 [Cimex lectularius]
MKLPCAFLLAVATLAISTLAKTYTECELVDQLLNYGFNKTDLANWVCLIKHGSNFSTEAKNTETDSDGKTYTAHGLFQISDEKWCENDKPGGTCKVKCEDLRKAMSGTVECAHEIHDEHDGFGNWKVWKENCNGTSLTEPNCPEEIAKYS